MCRAVCLALWLLAAGFAQDAPPDFRVDVDLVTVTFTAADRNGAPVENLRREELLLFDDGQRREIGYLWRETDLPLTVGLLADVSLTQALFVPEHRQTIMRFFRQVLGPRDRAFIVSVASDVVLVTDTTGSIEDLEYGIGHVDSLQSVGTRLGPECPPKMRRAADGTSWFVSGCGGTALWNSIFYAARLKLKPLAGRRALIVLSDGLDTGSTHSLTDAIEAAQGADTLVYTIVYPSGWSGTAAADRLERLALETGGRSFPAPKGSPARIFARIEEDLRNLYVLAFTPPPAARDGKFRPLAVKTTRRGVAIRARAGYSLPRPISSGSPPAGPE